MENMQDIVIADYLDPPWWITKLAPYNRIWLNPVFQRRLKKGRIKRSVGARWAFVIGVGFSLISFKIFLSIFNSIGMESDILLFLPYIAGIPLVYSAVRYFAAVILIVMTEMKGEFLKGEAQPILTAPISSQDIFVAECFAALMRGVGAIEEIAGFLSGMIIATGLVALVLADIAVRLKLVYMGLGLIILAFTVIVVIELLVLIVYTSGLYGLTLNRFWGSLVTTVQILIDMVGLYVLVWIGFAFIYMLILLPQIWHDGWSDMVSQYDKVLFICLAPFLVIFLLGLFIHIIINAGTTRLEKFRRPGRYRGDKPVISPD